MTILDQIQLIPVSKIRLTPGNCNEMPEEKYAAMKKAMQQQGLSAFKPVVLYTLSPEEAEGGRYIHGMVDGEKRTRAASELRWDQIPSIVRADIGNEAEARRLGFNLNYQKGSINPFKFCELVVLEYDSGLSKEEIAELYHKNVKTIIQILEGVQRISHETMEALKVIAKDYPLSDEKWSFTLQHLLLISQIPDRELQTRFAKDIVANTASKEQAEQGLPQYLAELETMRTVSHKQGANQQAVQLTIGTQEESKPRRKADNKDHEGRFKETIVDLTCPHCNNPFRLDLSQRDRPRAYVETTIEDFHTIRREELEGVSGVVESKCSCGSSECNKVVRIDYDARSAQWL